MIRIEIDTAARTLSWTRSMNNHSPSNLADPRLEELREHLIFHSKAKMEVKRVLDHVHLIRQDIRELYSKTVTISSSTIDDTVFARISLSRDKNDIRTRIESLADAVNASELYNGKNGLIGLGIAGYNINACPSHVPPHALHSTREALTELRNLVNGIPDPKDLAHQADLQNQCAFVQARVSYIDDILLPHLNKDFSTVEKASEAVRIEIQSHESLLGTPHASQVCESDGHFHLHLHLPSQLSLE
jgi:hypothetical protein